LVLDTCTLLAYARNDPSMDAVAVTLDAAGPGGLLVSPVTAWEIATLSRGKPRPETLVFRGDAAGWWRDAFRNPFLRLAAFTPEIALDAYSMPKPFHKDPADRFLVATARALGCPIVTSDSKILAYAAMGHVRALGF
jgi:PIN domain nuclease of toxin-antitoxin system